MICPRCWESLSANTAVCPSCGLTLSPTSAQRCPVCGARLVPGDTSCPQCGAQLIPQEQPTTGAITAAYEPPPAEELEGPPTTPYARPPIMRAPREAAPLTIPVLTPSAKFASSNSTATDAAEAQTLSPDATADEGEQAGAGGTTWDSVPPLLMADEYEDIPFAMTAASDTMSAEDTPASPAETEEAGEAATSGETDEKGEPGETAASDDDEGLPDYDTPDIERPAIHVVKPDLPDYETPDRERTAIHLVRPDMPGYETPDDEREAVHPTPAATPLDAQFAAMDISNETTLRDHAGNGLANGSHGLSESEPSYPGAYTSPHATQINQAQAQTPSTPSGPSLSASGDLVERVFGAQPAPRARSANTAIQRLWQRFLPPEWAALPWISIPVGALVALVVGLVGSVVGLLFWSRAIAYLLDSSNVIGANEMLVEAVHALNLLQLLLLEHGVPMSLALGSPGATGSFSALETLPLTGLSLLPACALILGGYVAAASDFSHTLRFSVLRGALVGPIYALLLALVALFGASTVRIGENTFIQLYPSVGQALLAGLLWGALLGALGGLLAIRRHHLFTTNRHPDLLAGGAWGALIALGSGLLLALVALLAGMAAHAIGTVPTGTAGQPGGGLAGVINGALVAIALLIVLAPVVALWLFALGTGATLDSWISASGTDVVSGNSTFGLLAAQHHPPSITWWLLLLIPLASYIIGGRAAAHIARAESLRDGALAGWLMAVGLSVILLALTLLSRLLISSEASIFGRNVAVNLGLAPSVGATFLLVLLIGGIFGALGGASAVLAPQPGEMLDWMVAPVLLELEPVLSVARRPWDMLDAARGRMPPRTPLRVLLYAAALSAVIFGALFLVVVLIGLLASRLAPISAVRGFDGFFAGIAVGVPLLLLASAAILATMRALPPLLTAHLGPVSRR